MLLHDIPQFSILFLYKILFNIFLKLFSPSTDIHVVSKYTIFKVVMLSRIDLPLALCLTIINYVFELYICLSIHSHVHGTYLLKWQIENVTFSQQPFLNESAEGRRMTAEIIS